MNKKNLLKTFKELAPLLLLSGYCVNIIIKAIVGKVYFAGEIFDFVPDLQHYLAMLCVAITIASYFLFRTAYRYLLVITIIAGVFNFIRFYPLDTSASISIGGAGIRFQPIAFMAGIIAFVVNFKKIYVSVFGNVDPKMLEEVHNKKFAEAVEKFKDTYADRSDESLNNIVAENRFVPEAVEAAKQLLNERAQSNGG